MNCKTCGIEGHDSQGNKELCLVAVVARCQRMELQARESSDEIRQLRIKLDEAKTDFSVYSAADTERRKDAQRLLGEATKAELDRWINALEELGFTVHPGLSVPENLVNFAEWWKDRKQTEKRKCEHQPCDCQDCAKYGAVCRKCDNPVSQ